METNNYAYVLGQQDVDHCAIFTHFSKAVEYANWLAKDYEKWTDENVEEVEFIEDDVEGEWWMSTRYYRTRYAHLARKFWIQKAPFFPGDINEN